MRKRSLSQSAITPSKSKRPRVVDPSIELAAAINDVGKELMPGIPEDTSSPEHISALNGDIVKNSSDDSSGSDVHEGIMKFVK